MLFPPRLHTARDVAKTRKANPMTTALDEQVASLEASTGQMCAEKIARGRAAFTAEDAAEVMSGIRASRQARMDNEKAHKEVGPLRGKELLSVIQQDVKCVASPFCEGPRRCGQNYLIAGPHCIYPGDMMTGPCFRVADCWVRPMNEGVADDLKRAGYSLAEGSEQCPY